MPIHVSLPAQFATLAGGAEEMELEGKTIGEVLETLAGRHTAFRNLLWTRDGQPNPAVVYFVNGRQIRAAEAPGTPLRDGDALLLVSAVEGG
jgi:molybdopterin synthase sulfur carrier subunit